ncbi:MAG: hypothetical protein N4A44_03800 [Alphaproteobacteria bacterium]|jgi:hypothetical protein|nr:hypothetical protein [Alphaproteobacteria bacterium]
MKNINEVVDLLNKRFPNHLVSLATDRGDDAYFYVDTFYSENEKKGLKAYKFRAIVNSRGEHLFDFVCDRMEIMDNKNFIMLIANGFCNVYNIMEESFMFNEWIRVFEYSFDVENFTEAYTKYKNLCNILSEQPRRDLISKRWYFLEDPEKNLSAVMLSDASYVLNWIPTDFSRLVS